MSMQTLTWDFHAAAVAGNSDAYSLALATQARLTHFDQNLEGARLLRPPLDPPLLWLSFSFHFIV